LGGFGCRVAAEARRLLHEVVDPVGVEFLALDQDELPIDIKGDLEPDEFWRIPSSRVTDVLTHLDVRGDGPSWRTLLPWLPAGEGLELLDALEPGGARQYRSLGRVGYFVAAKQIDRQLEMALDRLRLSGGCHGCTDEIRVVLVTSAAGGTGSGMFLDIAHRLQRIEPRAVLLLHLALPEIFIGLGDVERGKANTFATLAELLALRARLLPFRPCQACGGAPEGSGNRELFSRIFIHSRAAAAGTSAPAQTARAVARAIASQFEAVLQGANRTAVGALARLLNSPTEDLVRGHMLSHGGAASVAVPPFSLADDCVIDFLLSDLERASAGDATNSLPPPTQQPLFPPASASMPTGALPEAVVAAAQAWAAGLEQERRRIESGLRLFVFFSGRFREVDRIDPTLPVADKVPRKEDGFGNTTTLDLSLLVELPGFKEQLASLRQTYTTQGSAGFNVGSGPVSDVTVKQYRLHADRLRGCRRWLRWLRMQIKKRLDLLEALFANPSFVQELGIALREGLATSSGEATATASPGARSEGHAPPPKAVQDWLLAKLEHERPGLVDWYRSLGAENLSRAERRERLRSRLAGGEIENGLSEKAPLDGQELGKKLNELCVEAVATNPFIDRTPSCRQGEVTFLLVPERLENLEESTRALQEFRSRHGHPVEVANTVSDRLVLYTEDLLHPVTHLKRLDDYRHAYRNHGNRRALLHIDARFLDEPEDLYRFIGSPDRPPEPTARKGPELEDKPAAKARRAIKPSTRTPRA
jgi:hypothetical protein